MPASWRITVHDPFGVGIGGGIGHRGGLRNILSISYSIAKLDLRLVFDRTTVVLDAEDPDWTVSASAIEERRTAI